MDRGDDRVFSHLRHRLAPETVSDFGSRLSKDRHLARSLFESSQLELRILRRQIVAVRVQRICIARPEVLKDGPASCRIVDNCKSPRLTQTDRWRKPGNVDKTFECTLAAAAQAESDVHRTPDQKFAQLGTESVVELLHQLKLTNDLQQCCLEREYRLTEPFLIRRTT